MNLRQPEPLRSEDHGPGFLLARLGRGAAAIFRESLAATGLKPSHVAALEQLQSRPVGQQALSESTGLDPVRLVGILNDLETAGLIERRRDAVDRRRHIVAITCAGRARMAEVDAATARAEQRLLAALLPAQRDQLADLLRLVLATSGLGENCPGAIESANPCADEKAGDSD